MVQHAGRADRAHGNANARGVGRNDRTSTPTKEGTDFRKLLTSKLEDGALSAEEIQGLAEDIGRISHPRQRARQAQALRKAIRDAENLTDAERRDAVAQLNKAMAKRRPAWAKSISGEAASDTVEDAEVVKRTVDAGDLIKAAPKDDTGLEAPPMARMLGARPL